MRRDRLAGRPAMVQRRGGHESASPGAGSTGSRSPRASPSRSRPSSACVRPTTAMPTTIHHMGRLPAGRQSLLGFGHVRLQQPARPTRRWWARAGATCGSSVSTASGLWLETWLRHQRRDGYWRHGSIAEDYAAVQCPIMAVSGWADGYSNAVFRLLAHLDVPRRGLIGPWSHKYPHIGVPGPAIGFLQECVRWWDQWLKGWDTGVMEDPMLRVWMQDSVPPSASYDTRPGRWVAEPVWPSGNVSQRRIGLGPGRILGDGEVARTDPLPIQSPLTVGLFAGKWCSYAAGPDLAHDQRQEDGGALVFDSAPLAEPMEILGIVCVETGAFGRQAAGDGRRTPLGRRARWQGHSRHLRDAEPDPSRLPRASRTPRARAALPRAHQDERHRAELSVRASPAARGLDLLLAAGMALAGAGAPDHSSRAERDRAAGPSTEAGGCHPARIRPARGRAGDPAADDRGGAGTPWLVHRDLASDVSTLEVINDRGIFALDEIGLEIESRTNEWYTVRADDFLSPVERPGPCAGLTRGDWRIRTETRTSTDLQRDGVPHLGRSRTPTRATSACSAAPGTSRSRAISSEVGGGRGITDRKIAVPDRHRQAQGVQRGGPGPKMTFVGAWVSPQRTETGSHLRRCASDPKAESPSRAVTCLPLVRRGNATWACTMAP